MKGLDRGIAPVVRWHQSKGNAPRQNAKARDERKEGNTMSKLTKEESKIVSMMIDAYIKVMGVDKWNSLTDQQQHDVVMILVKDMLQALA